MQNETKAVRDRLIRSVRGSNDNNRKYNLFAFEKLQDVFLTKYILYSVKTKIMLSTNDTQMHSSYSSLITDDDCHDEVMFYIFVKRIISRLSMEFIR